MKLIDGVRRPRHLARPLPIGSNSGSCPEIEKRSAGERSRAAFREWLAAGAPARCSPAISVAAACSPITIITGCMSRVSAKAKASQASVFCACENGMRVAPPVALPPARDR
ncbi:hypothetical protein OMP43_08415 [Sphingomonas sp. CBMAI 2297]|uniref:hypothetical protein n=1 Tax=Sphingomonas sp. CBMAI 2297 TaxID=2991720 RepID=UPI00245836E1|nr:hypothetical protein [Sphingomonas sp. CBMAI 2297]MDH4744036.1 hypothetical protein [Sphingomonas sp. CBMAI 2297]